jgi:hypothetical protein
LRHSLNAVLKNNTSLAALFWPSPAF